MSCCWALPVFFGPKAVILGHPRAFGGPGLRAGCPRAQLSAWGVRGASTAPLGGHWGQAVGLCGHEMSPLGQQRPPPSWHRGRIQAGARPGSQGVINELMQPRYCVISSTQSTPCASSCCYRSLNVAPGGTFGTGTGLGCWGCPGGGCSPVTDPVAGCICWGKGSDPPQCCKSPA